MQIDRRKAMVLGGTAVVLLLPTLIILDLAIGPIITDLGQAATASALCQRFHQLEAEQPAYEAALTKGKAELAAQAMPDPRLSAELASANLQNTMQGLVAQAGGQVGSSAIASPETQQGLQILSVSLSLTLPQSRLAQLLAAITANMPRLTVQSLNIRGLDNDTNTATLILQLRVAEYRDSS